jgi:hypothetical protein
MGRASFSAASSWARSSLFCASGIALLALIELISFFICSGGSVKVLVWRRVGKPRFHLAARPFLPQHDGTALI